MNIQCISIAVRSCLLRTCAVCSVRVAGGASVRAGLQEERGNSGEVGNLGRR